jgi:hypothetical protein
MSAHVQYAFYEHARKEVWEYLWYIISMKLSQYAKQQGISYRTALRWWKAGLIKGYQATTGTIIVTEEPPKRPMLSNG